MLPLYRDGDMLVVQPNATVRKGDRVVVKTARGEVMAKVLEKRTATAIELASLNPEHPDESFRQARSNGWRASSGRASRPARCVR